MLHPVYFLHNLQDITSGHALDNASFHTTLIHYNGESWHHNINGILPDYPHPYQITGVIEGIYTDHPDSIWVKTEDGYFKAHITTEGEAENLGYWTDWIAFTQSVNGQTRNDVFFVGDWSNVWHYNGIDFEHFADVLNPSRFYSVSNIDDTTVIVGQYFSTSQAVVIIGRR